MTPQLVGISKNDLPLGKLSGKHAFAEKLKSLGYDIEPQNQAELFKQFKAIADKKKSVTDRDIHAIIKVLNMSKMQFIKLIHFNCSLFPMVYKVLLSL